MNWGHCAKPHDSGSIDEQTNLLEALCHYALEPVREDLRVTCRLALRAHAAKFMQGDLTRESVEALLQGRIHDIYPEPEAKEVLTVLGAMAECVAKYLRAEAQFFSAISFQLGSPPEWLMHQLLRTAAEKFWAGISVDAILQEIEAQSGAIRNTCITPERVVAYIH